MRPTGPPPRNLPDQIFRYLLQYGEHLQSLLQQVVPDLADAFDCEHAALNYPEFFGEDWRGRESDLPFLVPFRLADGAEGAAVVLVLVEHQSEVDPRMPLRMLHAIVSYWDRQWRDWERGPAPRAPLRLRPILPIVFYTGPSRWDLYRRLGEMLDEPAAFHRFAPTWNPLFWRLADYPTEEFLRSQDAWRQFLAVVRCEADDAAAFEAVCARALPSINRLKESDRVRWHDLMRASVAWMEYRRPVEERDRLRDVVDASLADMQSREEVTLMWKTIAEAERDAGRAEGRAEGRAQGEAAGRAEGQIRALRSVLLKQLEGRFGPMPESLSKRIHAMTEVDRLEEAVLAAPKLASLQDLRL